MGGPPTGGPHVWRTLGYRRTFTEPGRIVIEWDAAEDYTFPEGDDSIVHGGLVATVLDTAMGGACATLLEEGESFLTADLRVEFLRAARPGPCARKAPSSAARAASPSAPPTSGTWTARTSPARGAPRC